MKTDLSVDLRRVERRLENVLIGSKYVVKPSELGGDQRTCR